MTEPVTREGRDFVALTVRELYLRRGIVLDADEVAGLNERILAIEEAAGSAGRPSNRPDGPDDSVAEGRP